MDSYFLSSEGRISRLVYFVRLVLLAGLVAAATGASIAIFSHWHHGTFLPLGYFCAIVVALFCVLAGLMQLIKRLHDIGKAPYFAILLLVPGVNLLFLLYTLVAPPKAE